MRRRLIGSLLGIGALVAAATPLLAEPSASHRAAAAELLQLMEVREQAQAAVEKVLDMQLAQNPGMRAQREVILDWLREVVGSQEMMDRFAALYVERFTEAELRELIAFYRTPTGKRAVRELPALMEQGMLIGQELGQKHQAELERRLAAHVAQPPIGEPGDKPAAAKGAVDGGAARVTVAALRNVGTAMIAWVTDASDTLPMATGEASDKPCRAERPVGSRVHQRGPPARRLGA
jgi:hypothetical protein